MVKDHVDNIELYTSLSDRIAAALRYVRPVSSDGFAEGEIEISGRNVYAMHQLYTTKSDKGRLYENHRDHIDVQYVLEGTETIRVTDVGDLSVSKPYNEEIDAALYDLADGTDVKLGSGDFVILWPQDAHVPQLQSDSPSDVKKIVVKVRI